MTKLQCHFKVVYQNATNTKTKYISGFINLGMQDGEVYLGTSSSYGGTRYKVSQKNLQHVFQKFAPEGRSTLKFVNPPHDLLIQNADPVQLKRFLTALNATLSGRKSTESNVKLGTISPPKKITMPSLKRTVVRRYDQTEVHPTLMQDLSIQKCRLRKVPFNVLTLKHLRRLQLSECGLETLPDIKPDQLPNLRQLDVSKNKLTKVPTEFCFEISRTGILLVLDLSYNEITTLPNEICSSKLTYLNVGHNKLDDFPEFVANFTTLRRLDLSHNNLKYLHSQFRNAAKFLEHLDISGNKFVSPPDNNTENNNLSSRSTIIIDRLHVTPSLLEIAACKFSETGNVHHVVDWIPRPCLEYVRNVRSCSKCTRKVCVRFDDCRYASYYVYYSASQLANTIVYENGNNCGVPLKMLSCSYACMHSRS